MNRLVGIIALAVYFIWGQGWACAWWITAITVLLIILVLIGRLFWLQLISSLFLIWVACFAPNTFGYDQKQINAYLDGESIGRMCHMYGKGSTADEFWEVQKDYRQFDDKYRKFWMRGFHQGLKGKSK